jgi:hypothetical protein
VGEHHQLNYAPQKIALFLIYGLSLQFLQQHSCQSNIISLQIPDLWFLPMQLQLVHVIGGGSILVLIQRHHLIGIHETLRRGLVQSEAGEDQLRRESMSFVVDGHPQALHGLRSVAIPV